MDTITVLVGSVVAMSNATQDRTREVEFEGEFLAELREFGEGKEGRPPTPGQQDGTTTVRMPVRI